MAEIVLEASDLKKGDKFIITGQTTGLVRGEISELRNEKMEDVEGATKTEIITLPIDTVVRTNDKLYKLVERKDFR